MSIPRLLGELDPEEPVMPAWYGVRAMLGNGPEASPPGSPLRHFSHEPHDPWSIGEMLLSEAVIKSGQGHDSFDHLIEKVAEELVWWDDVGGQRVAPGVCERHHEDLAGAVLALDQALARIGLPRRCPLR